MSKLLVNYMYPKWTVIFNGICISILKYLSGLVKFYEKRNLLEVWIKGVIDWLYLVNSK